MIVKNEANNLSRCLDSLDVIRKEIDSELIIVDTGSTDKTVEIANSYTNRVYYHEWENNFSKMRNISLGYATGEWILVMDADEEIAECSGILDAFKASDLLEKSNTLMLPVKDFMQSSNPNAYNEYLTPRFFKNDGNFHFEGSIHNQAMYLEPTHVISKSILYHYGYDADNESLIRAKVERTSKMLLTELEQKPNDLYYLYQLSAIYRMGKRFDEGFEAIEKAFNLLSPQEYESNKYIVKHYVLMLRDLEKYKQITKLAEKIERNLLIDIDLAYFFADSWLKLGDKKRSRVYFNEYLRLHELKRNGNWTHSDLSEATLTSALLNSVYNSLLEIAYDEKNYEEVYRLFDFIDKTQLSETTIEKVTESILKIDEIEYFQRLVEIVADENTNIKNAVIRTLEKHKIEHLELNFEKWENETKRLSASYEILLLARALHGKGQSIQTQELIQFFDNYFNSSNVFYSEFLFYALINDLNAFNVLQNYSNVEIEEIIMYLNETFEEFKVMAVAFIEQNQDSDFMRIVLCLEWLLLSDMSIDQETKMTLGYDFIINRIGLLYETYKREILETGTDFLEEKDKQFAKLSLCLLDKIDWKTLQLELSSEKSLQWDVLINVVDIHTSELVHDLSGIWEAETVVNNQMVENSISEEFMQLKLMMIQQVKQFIQNNQPKYALAVIEEYLQIVPSDVEMLAIKADILGNAYKN